MVKEKRILSYFMGWLLLGFVIMLIGINNVFALETNFENLRVQGYNNNGTSLTNPNVFNCSAGSCGMEITTNVNSYGGAWAIQSPIPLLKNHTYTLSLRIRNTNGIGITLSAKNRIAVGNSIDSVKYNYEIGDYWNTLKTSMATGNYTLQFVFTPTGQASYLLVPFTTTSTTTTSFMIDNIIIEDLGSEGVSQEEINNSLNNQTNTLNNSIQNSTNTITGEIDDMEQSIIDNQNSNTDKEIESQKVCKNYDYTTDNVSKSNGYLTSNGSIVDGGNSFKHTDYIKLQKNETYTLTTNFTNNNLNYCLYNSDKTLISCQRYNSQSFTIIPNDDGFIRYSTRETYQVNFTGKFCENGNQALNDKLDDVNNTSKGIWETIKNLPNMFLDMLLGLFIPKDLSFINEFKDVISNKLGFIASVPIQIIDFALGLADVAFNEITTISFPSIEIFGVHFWNAEEIDITILLEKLKPFKYFTDFTCVILCCRTLYDMYHNFTGGGAD